MFIHTGVIMTSLISVVDLKAEIDKLASEYMSSARRPSSEEKLALLRQIQVLAGMGEFSMTRCSCHADL